jgi:hypothetical protein
MFLIGMASQDTVRQQWIQNHLQGTRTGTHQESTQYSRPAKKVLGRDESAEKIVRTSL